MRSFVGRLFRNSRFVELGLFEPDYIQRLVAQHISGQTDHSYRLWILINLELWHRLYLENETVGAVREEIEHGKLSARKAAGYARSEEHTSELQSLMRNSYAVFCLKKKKKHKYST